MGDFIYFDGNQKLRANSVDIVEFLRRHGENLIPSGREYRLASDHSITVRGSEWFDHADSRGGRAVSFVQKHYGLSYPEAMLMLLGDEHGAECAVAAVKKEEPPKPFVLPPAHSDMRRVYAYLLKQRCIDRDVLSAFAKAGLFYEDTEYHNCVFVGIDENGQPRHAHKRSVNSMGKPFRLNVEGSLPQYSFHYTGTSEYLYVFEAPIDLLSFITLHPTDWQKHSYVALCGTGSKAMLWMLEQNPCIKNTELCLDNDEAGKKAALRFSQALEEVGCEFHFIFPQLKDWNDDLCGLRQAPTAVAAMEMG